MNKGGMMHKPMIAAMLLVSGMIFLPATTIGQNAPGSDISSAIQISIGQSIEETADNTTRPHVVYRLTLPAGRDITVQVKSLNKNALFFLTILAPTSVSVLQNRVDRIESRSFVTDGLLRFTPAVSDTYYIWLHFPNNPSVTYRLTLFESGVQPGPQPPTSPPPGSDPPKQPPTLQCISGSVNEFQYSSAAANVISFWVENTRICTDCLLKPPVGMALSQKLELALINFFLVEACFNFSGEITTLTLRKR